MLRVLYFSYFFVSVPGTFGDCCSSLADCCSDNLKYTVDAVPIRGVDRCRSTFPNSELHVKHAWD